ncbi:MAG: hypothetical protein IKX37_04665 [Bacteroidales bacterium]|nr:hypothetical protein [Bacteroidales bacterium]
MMRTKWFFVYIGVGVAFAAVSLWVFLSGGRNARAIRTKYKLGGVLLMSWAMLSASTCHGPGPFVTCYEPVVQCYDVAIMEDNVELSIKEKEGTELQNGDILQVRILQPTASRYIGRIKSEGDQPKVLLEATFDVPENSSNSVEWEWAIKNVNYKGEVMIEFYSSGVDADGNKLEQQISGQSFTLK